MSKFEIYNSPELNVLKDLFQTMPMMDCYIANLIESYIYSSVEKCHENGNIKAKYTTKYGEPHGKYTEWNDDGRLKIECNFKDGKLHGEYIEKQPNHVTIKTTFNEGKIHGFYTKISDKTDNFEEYIMSQENYFDGKKEGISIEYWGKDRVRVINKYSNNKLNGECNSYHQNGWLLCTQNFVNGIQNGEQVWYHSGGVKSRYNVVNRKIQGEYLEYDRDGNISKRLLYKDDKVELKLIF